MNDQEDPLLSLTVLQIRHSARLKVLEGMVMGFLSSGTRSPQQEQLWSDYEKNVREVEDLHLRALSDRNPNIATYVAKLLEEARNEKL